MADDFLKRNALRLLREKWDSPSALAQEFYTILADEPSGALSTRSVVAQARQESAKSAPIPQLEQSPRSLRALPGIPGSSFEDLAQHLTSRLAPAVEQVRKPGFMPGVTPVPGMIPPGEVRYVEPHGSRADQIVWRQPHEFVMPPRREPEEANAEVTWERVRDEHTRSTSVSVAGPGLAPAIARSSPSDLTGLPAHVEFGVSPVAAAYSYPPLGVPGAYSGQERVAGDYNPVNGPIYRELPADDPFARKYYDLRFFLPDFDSVRATGGDGGSSTLIGKVTTTGKSPVQVMLYPDGPNSDPSPSSAVPVNILQLATGETIPANMWITGILKAGDGYYAQIPVWLSDDEAN